MDEHGAGDGPQPSRGLGGTALVAGLIAVAAVCVPVIGEFIAVPAAALAVILGWVGFDRAGRGLTRDGGRALIGGGLGLTAGFLMFLVIVATTAPND